LASAAPLFDVGSTRFGEEVAGSVRHVPTWVQVISSGASLYTLDGAAAVAVPSLRRYTFLRVLAPGTERLEVQVYDANGQPGATGWVDPDDVAPSAPGLNWLVSSVATTLTHADASTSGLEALTPLQQIDGPMNGQIEVRVYRADLSGVVAQGWVAEGDTGPALPPQLRVPSPAGDGLVSRRASRSPDAQQAFLTDVESAAVAARAQTGVPASVTVAQAILESDWGRSILATGASNYFGVKALGGLGNDGVVWLPTSEYDAEGQEYETMSPFRAYKSLRDSTVDHDRLLAELGRYAPAMQAAGDPREFAQLLVQGGYSTDPAYADKLIALMDTYDLYALDS
jgi:hypothetical protein